MDFQAVTTGIFSLSNQKQGLPVKADLVFDNF